MKLSAIKYGINIIALFALFSLLSACSTWQPNSFWLGSPWVGVHFNQSGLAAAERKEINLPPGSKKTPEPSANATEH